MDNIVKIIGKRIKQLREKQGYSKTQLSKLSGVHIAWIGRLEEGERETGKALAPSIITLEKITKALNIDIEDLFDDENIRKSTFPDNATILKEIKQLLTNQTEANKLLFLQMARKILKYKILV